MYFRLVTLNAHCYYYSYYHHYSGKKTGFEGGPNTSFIVVAVFDTGYCCSAATPGMMGSWFARLPMESHPEVNGVASRND